MSIAAVCKATRATLQALFQIGAEECEVGFDGQPKPACGERYWSVHPLNHGSVSNDWDLGEQYEVGVTLTMRMGFAPRDRWGIGIWLADSGMEDLCRQAIIAIHHSQTLRAVADALITGGTSGKIVTPLQFIRLENPVPRMNEWFSAPPPEGDRPKIEAGASQTIVFGKCQRIQSIPDMD